MTVTITNQLFGTHPLAIHCPGPLHADWNRTVAEALTPAPPCKADDVTVLTWHGPNRTEKPNGLLERSLDRLGLTAQVLEGRGTWQNRQKLALTAEALQEIQTPYVISADSSDVIFLDNPQLAVERFAENFNCGILFNATGSRCWPELPRFVEYQTSRPLAQLAHGRHWGTRGPCPAVTHAGPFPGCLFAPVLPSDKYHQTGKPTRLLRELVRVAPPDGLILDPFAGSGTTLVAAKLEGRRAIGIERERPICETAADRLRDRQTLEQLAAA